MRTPKNRDRSKAYMCVGESFKHNAPIGDCGDVRTLNRGLTVINESGLYSLILSSKLPSAKRFKRWVTSEVLPAIRKHGVFVMDDIVNNTDAISRKDLTVREQLKHCRSYLP